MGTPIALRTKYDAEGCAGLPGRAMTPIRSVGCWRWR